MPEGRRGPAALSGRTRVEAEYLIEHVRIGSAVKVIACDPRTLTEVSIVGSALTPEPVLERAAVRKLEAVLSRNSARRT